MHHYKEDGILAFSLHPGGINTELQHHRSGLEMYFVKRFAYSPAQGTLTQVFAGTSTMLKKEDSGKYFIPWAREDLPMEGTQDIKLAEKLWDFLEKETAGNY